MATEDILVNYSIMKQRLNDNPAIVSIIHTDHLSPKKRLPAYPVAQEP